MALRLARIVNIRKDKSPTDATSLEFLKQTFESQFEYEAKLDLV